MRATSLLARALPSLNKGFTYLLTYFPYDRPDRPDRPSLFKIFRDDPDD